MKPPLIQPQEASRDRGLSRPCEVDPRILLPTSKILYHREGKARRPVKPFSSGNTAERMAPFTGFENTLCSASIISFQNRDSRTSETADPQDLLLPPVYLFLPHLQARHHLQTRQNL